MATRLNILPILKCRSNVAFNRNVMLYPCYFAVPRSIERNVARPFMRASLRSTEKHQAPGHLRFHTQHLNASVNPMYDIPVVHSRDFLLFPRIYHGIRRRYIQADASQTIRDAFERSMWHFYCSRNKMSQFAHVVSCFTISRELHTYSFLKINSTESTSTRPGNDLLRDKR